MNCLVSPNLILTIARFRDGFKVGLRVQAQAGVGVPVDHGMALRVFSLIFGLILVTTQLTQ